jgi:DNA-binding beta-propeller fold protein YncE
VHAFVHSLSLDRGFAYCIDLPTPFGEGPIDAHAIGLTTVDNPYVVDVSSGSLAMLNGADLTVQGVSKPLPAGRGPASTVASRETTYVAAANIVHVLDARSLTSRTQWTLTSPVRGLALSPDGERLWVGQTDGLVALDASSGRPVGSVPMPGLTTLRHASVS